jgi:hypothetical protein
MGDYYGDITDVKTISGITAHDLGLEDTEGGLTAEEKLDDLLEKWLISAKDYIDMITDTTFDTEVNPGISNIAERIVLNLIGLSTQRRVSPIIKSNDFNVQLVEDKVISPSIRKDLEAYSRKHAGSTSFSLSISNRLTREEDEDAED